MGQWPQAENYEWATAHDDIYYRPQVPAMLLTKDHLKSEWDY